MRNRKLGFTLVELLVVIAIIAVLAAILFPVFAAVKRAARMAADVTNLQNVASTLKTYMLDHGGHAPSSLYALELTATAPGDLEKQPFSYQEDGFGNVLYNYYGYTPDGYAAPSTDYYEGGPNTARGMVWPPAIGGAGWEAHGINDWGEFPMIRNPHAPPSTIITWTPYNRSNVNGGPGPTPYDEGSIAIVRLDGSCKKYAKEASKTWAQADATSGLTPFQHQTTR